MEYCGLSDVLRVKSYGAWLGTCQSQIKLSPLYHCAPNKFDVVILKCNEQTQLNEFSNAPHFLIILLDMKKIGR